MTHDPFCMWHDYKGLGLSSDEHAKLCQCAWIARIRADERAKVTQ